MNRISLHENKVLKLQNVVSLGMNMEKNVNIDLLIDKMDTYIQTHGAKQIGPINSGYEF